MLLYRISVVGVCLFSCCFGLYEDQIEKFDWRHQYLGKPDAYAIGAVGMTVGRVFIASDAHVLGSVNLKDGSIEWRQALEEGSAFLGFKLCGNYIISISHTTRVILRVWDALKGHILSELPLESDSPSAFIYCSDQIDISLIYLKDRVITMKLSSQEILIENDIAADFNDFNEIVAHSTFSYNEEKHVVLLLASRVRLDLFAVLKFKFSAVDESLFKSHHWIIEKPGKSGISKCLLQGDLAESVVCLGKNSVFWARLKIDQHVDWRQNDFSVTALDIWPITGRHILIKLEDNNGLVFIDDRDRFALQFKVDNLTLGIPLDDSDQTSLLVLQRDEEKQFQNLHLRVFDLSSGLQKTSSYATTLTLNPNHGQLERVALLPDGWGFLLFTEDHAFQAVSKEGIQIWHREESLAHVVSVEMIDLPVSAQEASMEEEFGNGNVGILQLFINRIRSQIIQLKEAARFLFQSDVEKEADNSAVTLGAIYEPLTRDSYNLQKILVVVTSTGKLFGIESTKGRIVWEYMVPDTEIFGGEESVRLFQQRTTGHFPLRPVTSVLLKSKNSGLPLLLFFDPIYGVPLDKSLKATSKDDCLGGIVKLSQSVVQAVLVPGPVSEKTGHLRPLCLIFKDLSVGMFPSTLALRNDLLPLPGLFVYSMQATESIVTGYRVTVNKQASPRLSQYSAHQVWHMILSSKDSPQEIVLAASRPANEHIYSIGRVLGDRNVLYKYINPNLLVLLTVGESVSEKIDVVSLYLIDVVVGQVIHSAVHRRCSRPVSLVVSENWVLYSLYNQRPLRSEVMILELFEPVHTMSSLVPSPWQLFTRSLLPASWMPKGLGLTGRQCGDDGEQSVSCWTSSVFSSQQRAANSAFGNTPTRHHSVRGGDPGLLIPAILQRSFILASPTRPGAVAVTLTERGITAKSLLFGLESGSVLELSKALLDPRRTLEVTPELQEEGLEPYSPELPMSTLSVISYNKSIERIRRIHTAPSGLESTSLVFIHGLDVFFTRIAPSKTYDLLRDDFDNWFIAMITIGMVVGTFVAQRLAARKELNKAWQ